MPAPANTVAPAVTGTPAAGSTLSCSQGTWTGSPAGFAYQWRRNGGAILDARSATYVVGTVDAGQSLSCQVTAFNDSGTVSAVSNAVSVTRPASAVFAEADPVAEADLATHAALTTAAHGGIVASSDGRLTDTRTPTDASVTAAKLAAAVKPSGSAAATDEAVRALGAGAGAAATGTWWRVVRAFVNVNLTAAVQGNYIETSAPGTATASMQAVITGSEIPSAAAEYRLVARLLTRLGSVDATTQVAFAMYEATVAFITTSGYAITPGTKVSASEIPAATVPARGQPSVLLTGPTFSLDPTKTYAPVATLSVADLPAAVNLIARPELQFRG